MSFISKKIRQLVGDPDLAIDLGTANTRLYAFGLGIVAEEPSLVQINPQKEAVTETTDFRSSKKAIGMVSPLRAGVIDDINATVLLLKPLFQRARRFGLMRPRVLACAPTDTSEKERNALAESNRRAGGAEVVIIPEPLAAAIGAGLDVASPYAQMIVDIGDGVTDIAIIREGQIIKTAAIRKACSDLQIFVLHMVAQRYGIWLYPKEVERLMQDLDSIRQTVPQRTIMAMGFHLKKRCEISVEINQQEVFIAMEPIVYKILLTIEMTLRQLPPEIACEVFENGIYLTGGGACIKGMDRLVASKINLNVQSANDPMHAVINGAIQILQYGDRIEHWWESITWPISPSTRIRLAS